MAATATEADRIRVSDDMVGATSGLVSAMLRSKMISKDALPGMVRDIHSALIDISLESVSVIEKLDSLGELPVASRPERHPVSSESISRAVSKLLNMSTTEVEPPVPHQVRMPPTPAAKAPEARAPSPELPATPPKASPPPANAAAPATARNLAESIPVRAPKGTPDKPVSRLRTSSPEIEQQPVSRTPPAPEAKKLEAPSAPWTGEERRARPIKPKPVIEPTIPKRLTSIEEAINFDFIVCLEDGRKVKDLREHLAKLKMTPEQYRAKWKLPAEYPMVAPAATVKRTDKRVETYEIDLVTGKIRKAR